MSTLRATGRGDAAAAARSARAVVLAAVVALAVAEAFVAFVGPVIGAAVHGLLLIVLLLGWVGVGDPRQLVLALVPLGRITSLALTPDSTGAAAYALTGLPLLVAVVWVLRDLARRDRALRPRQVPRPPSWLTVVVALTGVPLGWGVHELFDLPAAGGVPLVVAAPVVFVFAGVLEELLYRGLVQRALIGPFGRAGVVLADVLFAAAYLPTHDAVLVLTMAVLGLGAGEYMRRTHDLTAVAVAHGLLAAGALVLWPALT